MLKKILLVLLALPTLSFAGVHVMQGDSVTFSSITVTGTGIKLPDGTVITSTSTLGPGASINLGTQVTGTLGVNHGGTGATSATLIGGQNIGISGSFPSQTVTLVGVVPVALGGTGSASPSLVAGTNISITGSWPNQTITGTGSSSGGVTLSSFSATAPVLYNNSTGAFSFQPISLSTGPIIGILPVASGGTGTASPGLVAGTNITSITGTWPNQTINAATQSGSSGSLTYSSFTATAPILYNNTNGAFTFQSISLSTGPVIGILPVANGGNGTATPALVAGRQVAISGSWPTQTVSDTGVAFSSFSATVPVIYNNATGAFSLTQISLSTGVTGSLPAASIASGSLGASVLASSFPVTGVTPGSYTNSNLTINAQGLVTAASTGAGGSGSGATLASQLLDCQVTRIDASHLAIASTATVTSPCIINYDGVDYFITSSATVTLGAVAGISAMIYIADGSTPGENIGTIQVRNSGSSGVTCTGNCAAAQANLNSLPTGGIVPLALWNATVSGVWDSTGTNYRPSYSATVPYTGSTGIIVSGKTISRDATTVSIHFSSAGAPGSYPGSSYQDVYDDSTTQANHYACMKPGGACTAVGANNWVLQGGTGGGSSPVQEDYLYPTVTYTPTNGPYAGSNWSFVTGNLAFQSGYGADNDIYGVQFDNTHTDTATVTTVIPVKWDSGTITFNINWYQVDGSYAGTNVRWTAETFCQTVGNTLYAVYNASQTATSSTLNNAVMQTTTFPSLTTTGCSAGNPLKIRVHRDNTVGSNYTGHAQIFSGMVSLKHS